VQAFETLIQGVERQMLMVAAGLASYPDEADDIYQEAVLNAFNALPKFRAQSQFSTWLYRIFVNTALSYKRKLSHRLSRQLAPDEQIQGDYERYQSAAIGDTPEHHMANQQLSVAITQALGALSEKERVAFVLCHQQELTVVEASYIMACTEGSVKSYLFRARDKLRKLLKGHQR